MRKMELLNANNGLTKLLVHRRLCKNNSGTGALSQTSRLHHSVSNVLQSSGYLRYSTSILKKQLGSPPSECTKIARLSAVAAAIFTAPGKIARLFEAPRCAISSAKTIASEPRFSLR